ncbi:prolyl-tRNA synthetase associated domain-containing protein [Tepidibacter aestuarii]|uniref:prolyl-tRNA synthetase associated domain-containing protein n=1 Tax=Tepidibacter aestuarii TaxID=2925782 RepID=UPI0020BDB6CE|nr:prolyl-tRNA synthetase associated domain-containing protein [Tepidibacter aestuarii]CAH2212245.1 Prolyl-tRNA editing protein ProX [Tepidibacter aestuarii]
MIENEKAVYDILEKLSIEYEKYTHIPVYTIEEADNLNLDIKGAHCKNLFVRDRKGRQHYLIIIEDNKKVDLKKLSWDINSTNLSFASEERLFKYLKLKPGSVTAFGLINDKDKHVKLLIDKDLKNFEYISFHPNVNTATVTISYEDFEKFLEFIGNEVNYIEV